MARQIVIPYRPRDPFMPFHERTQRWASLVVHRRGGKTVASINELQKKALCNTRKWPPPKYAYVAPFLKQAKQIAWGYAKHYSNPIPGCELNESDLKIRYPTGAELRLFGADNPDSLRGDYLDGVVKDERADWDPSVWPLVIRPMLADFQGWAADIGTPKGHNDFYTTHRAAEADPEHWFTMTLRASESGLIPFDELEDLRGGMSNDQYAQEFECSFDAAIQGAIYPQEISDAEKAGRVTQCPWQSELEVFTAWDLGFDDDTAIWFGQMVGREVHWIDYLEVRGLGLPEIVKRLRDKPYNYGKHYLPHDVEVTELNDGRSRRETLEGLGCRPVITAPRQTVWERINATRVMFSRFWFDKAKCGNALERLKQYRREYDADRKVFKEKPAHDENSHCADSIGTFAQAYRDDVKKAHDFRPRLGTLA